MAYLLLKVHLPRFDSMHCISHKYLWHNFQVAEIPVIYFADLNYLSSFLSLSPHTYIFVWVYFVWFNLQLGSFVSSSIISPTLFFP